MRWRLPLPSKQKFANVAAILLSVLGTVFAQDMPTPPIPTWSGVGSIPKGNESRRVFLSPDEHSVIVLWPSPDGTETWRRFDLHNTIFPELRLHLLYRPA